ncbi:MBL fold metallo-hydrolase [Dermatophilus congolensis]|uniref:MBL fold metallo-hydrolase n=1 Tax=Dermatophilus congolensis TaxID=1863 RepID=UPI001D385950|nr:MBL fold metallo-hydrolase [Dermatophilus congolensis]MBO3144039.1 MBL fold metallo-hydrolase [Dermatophilus congolensis]MBO3153025.1 MBL fold metallo-hydrolase [Dermatophilus congolensis]MBO3159956.1 MBL fold metallo-hydrolase [Dermatophilus congolensis]MBO3164316.1 MBL fold metallo-hydrolase [Dermatophilus congolensis]MBO3177865.1 MBL fold metallo-hydrolase [Dermatophilus congolensis]
MTLEGTNTYILRAPGKKHSIIIDPGPADPTHIATILTTATSDEAEISHLLLTHHHADHAAAIPLIEKATGLQALSIGTSTLTDGQTLHAEGLTLHVIATPGHTADSTTFRLHEAPLLFTGDTILGRGTTWLDYPDGTLTDYLHTLHLLSDLLRDKGEHTLLPGHGPTHSYTAPILDAYIQHRTARLRQIRAARDSGAGTDIEAITNIVYRDQPESVLAAARICVAAQLDHLRHHDTL